ncbi:DUF6804 family protein, partial [Bacteroides sp. 214]|uniref:DUF6804 family protein n=1 Tax=Bacteroides sp. 214 TaxID=2302935 RepID=UPI00351B2A51
MHNTVTLVWVALAVLFQPFIKLPLGRELWNGKKNPYLYTVIAELYDNGKLIDRVS